MNFLWFSPRNIHLTIRSRRSLTSCSKLRKTWRKRSSNYVKWFKVNKAKIIECDNVIANASFRKRLLTDHPMFGELIMRAYLTLANLFAMTKKHSLWDEAKRLRKYLSKLKMTWWQLKKRQMKSSSTIRTFQETNVETIPRRKKARHPRHSQSSQSRSTRSLATLRTNYGSSCHYLRMEIPQRWTKWSIALSTEVQDTRPVTIKNGRKASDTSFWVIFMLK